MKTIPLLLVCLLGATHLATAEENFVTRQSNPRLEREFIEKPTWVEKTDRLPLPSWPQDADLVAFDVGHADGQWRYFIDGKTLTIGQDGIVRYTLVAKSATGGANYAVEGIRCTPRGAVKTYAYGSQGRFHALTGEPWQPLSGSDTEPYRRTLWQDHLCQRDRFAPQARTRILRSLHTPTRVRQPPNGFTFD